ncbi:MAG: tRNA (guanine37-N1)-methyltransferase [Clostridiales bacterium]|nr:tRNA (guanine37-N1)-methyltransferase [Clostridiales bacterium]
MEYHVLTLFPEMIEQGMNTSIMGRAIENQQIALHTVNIRDFSDNKHHKVDDYPYGGGAGMVMQAEPIYRAYQSLSADEKRKHRVIYLTPQGSVFSQKKAQELAKEEELVFLCGHYEGVDERVLEMIVTDYISIGDYVLTGGELAAMVVMDAIARLVPGVLNNEVSAETESFDDNLLEYPQYSRPEVWREKAVPAVLLSGHHKNIEEWRRHESMKRTLERRPDLLVEANLSKKERRWLQEYQAKQNEK